MTSLIVYFSTIFIGCSDSRPSEGDNLPSSDSGTSSELEQEDCSQMDFAFFEEKSGPLMSTKCFGCHNENSVAADTRHVLLPFDTAENTQINFDRLRAFATETDDGSSLLLEKPTNQTSHAGGQVIDMLEPRICHIA